MVRSLKTFLYLIMQSISEMHVTTVRVCSVHKITKQALGTLGHLDSFSNYGPFGSRSAERVQQPYQHCKTSLRDPVLRA
jgi:hypothetical protein